MKISTNGQAQFKLQSGTIVELSPDDLEWQQVAADEGGMGHSITYEAEYEFEDGTSVTWTLIEYPAGAQNFAETQVSGDTTVISDFDYGLEHTPED